MTQLTRRGFLQGAAVAVVVTASGLKMVDAHNSAVTKEILSGTVDEQIQYAIEQDAYLVRHTIRYMARGRNDMQIVYCTSHAPRTMNELERIREMALVLMRDHMAMDGVTEADLLPAKEFPAYVQNTTDEYIAQLQRMENA